LKYTNEYRHHGGELPFAFDPFDSKVNEKGGTRSKKEKDWREKERTLSRGDDGA